MTPKAPKIEAGMHESQQAANQSIRSGAMNQQLTKGLFAVLILALPAISGCGWIDSLKARDQINKGVKSYEAKDYEGAVEHFSKAAELDPSLLHAKLYLAHAKRAQWTPGIPHEDNVQKAREAIEAFEDVLKDDSENINAMASIAGIYDGLDEADKAKEWYQKRIEVEPDNPEPYYGIGAIDQRLSQNLTGTEGANVEELSDEERAQAEAYTDEGVEKLKKALELKPDYADAVEYLNLIYREKAYLAQDEEQRQVWEREASKLALQVIELRKEQKLKEERERREFFKTEKEGQ